MSAAALPLPFRLEKPAEALEISLIDIDSASEATFVIDKMSGVPAKKKVAGLSDSSAQAETLAMSDVRHAQLGLARSALALVLFAHGCALSFCMPLAARSSQII